MMLAFVMSQSARSGGVIIRGFLFLPKPNHTLVHTLLLVAAVKMNSLFLEEAKRKKTIKERDESFMKLLDKFVFKESGKISLHGFFDCLDEHGVYVVDDEVDNLCLKADDDGGIERSLLFEFARTSKFWDVLIKKDVYADEEVLKLMSKSYNLSGRPQGPPQISKIDNINKTLNRVSASFDALDKDNDGYVTKKDFSRSFPNLTPDQVKACFKKFDKDKDGRLNFTEYKNFMAKRKSLPDKALARCTSTLSLRSSPPTYSTLSIPSSASSCPPSYSNLSIPSSCPPSYSNLSIPTLCPPKYEDIPEEN